ncbi:uncharacterized protein LOC129226372 [Uloborus diversus]|uniref:uncharacterized protein LOC129226372 n=1 Tax=Uloborus diversus TaxID=327109 RepID=UPI0024093534|nr:uncharacterized protein LOC129226372 [Uloborus diversus]
MSSEAGDFPVLLCSNLNGECEDCDSKRHSHSSFECDRTRSRIKRKCIDWDSNVRVKINRKNSKPLAAPNVINLLTRRSIGSNVRFMSDFISLKAKQLSITNFFSTADSGIHITDCEFIRGAQNGLSLIGLWKGDPQDSVIYRLSFTFNSRYSYSDESSSIVKSLDKIGPFFALTRVKDMCDARFRQQNCVLYVGNRFNDRSGIEGSTVLCNFSNNIYTYGRQYISKRDILSCAGSQLGDLFATGTEQGCYIFDDDRFTYKARLPGNVRSIEFNKTGEMLFCGVDTAGLTVFDLREPPWNRRTVRVNRFGPVGVSETKLLSDEKTMIISGSDGSLSKIDLTTNQTLITYPGHVGSYKKIPFSISESADILCATGCDNLTRLWSLSTGKQLHSIQPYFTGYKSHSWIISYENHWFIAMLQKDQLYTMEPVIY